MSDKLTFEMEPSGLVIKYDDRPIPSEKLPALMEILAEDIKRAVERLERMTAEKDKSPQTP